MDGKEALNTLFDLLCERTHTNSEHSFWLKQYNCVLNDLEVLEILKRIDWLVFNNRDKNDFHWYIDTNKSMIITEEETNKLKEWLENMETNNNSKFIINTKDNKQIEITEEDIEILQMLKRVLIVDTVDDFTTKEPRHSIEVKCRALDEYYNTENFLKVKEWLEK